jgi:hypothetical protein
MADITAFEKEVENAINRASLENGSDTPDFILAAYLRRCLQNFNATLVEREKWYGRPIHGPKATVGDVAPSDPIGGPAA